MANRAGQIVAGVFLTMICATLWAQQKKAAVPAKKKTVKTDKSHSGPAHNAMLMPRTYLGQSDYCGGPIKVALFDSLLKQGITARDSSGRAYQIVSFHFNYAERRIYEDSAANLQMMIDYTTEPCYGNTIDTILSARIFDRVKGGDTAYIEQVLLTQMDTHTDTFLGKGMKCVITK